MTHLPAYDPSQVVMQSDLLALRSDVEAFRHEMVAFRRETVAEFAGVRRELHSGLASVNQRIDRFFLALLGGAFGIIAAMAGVIIAVLHG